MAYSGIRLSTAEEAKFEQLFQDLVPTYGKSDTKAGEMVRAMMRLMYRFDNDGDLVSEGYGYETCNSSNTFLVHQDIPGWANLECRFHNEDYRGRLHHNAKALLDYIEANPGLKEMPNTIDCVEAYREYEPYDDEDEDDEEY